MQVAITDLNGRPLGQAELRQHSDGRLLLDGRQVITTQIIGSQIVLILDGRQVCVSVVAYSQARHAPARL
jgi:hypothetical protein